MNRRDFRRLAEIRLADAQILLANRRYAAAYYLAGYAVECGLKACIAKQFKLYVFPLPPRDAGKLYTHSAAELVTHGGLTSAFTAQISSVPGFESNWTVVAGWTERSRYKHDWSREQAEKLIIAITQVPGGVMEWIRQLW